MTSVQTYEVIAEFEMESGALSGVSRPPTPPLFDQTRLRKPEYWQCIKLIAPASDASRIWRTSEALGAWCIPCHKRVRWRLGKSTGVHRHMELYHQDLLEGPRFKNRRVSRPKSSRHSTPPPLFNQVRLRKPEYWQCIKLIAPSDERKAWKASEALGSWCTLCEEEVTWTLGNIQGVKRHMNAQHPDLLQTAKEEEDDYTHKEEEEEGPKELFKSLNKDHQKIGEAVLIKWITETLQSFDVVEKGSFQDLVQFLCNFKGEFTLPDEEKVSRSIQSLAGNLSNKMLESISGDVRYYCLCVNSSRVLSRDLLVLELILKYLTPDFELKSLTLEMEPTNGVFTRESITAWLETSLQKWGLPLATLSALTSDHNGSLLSACKTMGITHLGCISRGLRRIASVFLSDEAEEPDLEQINVEELFHSAEIVKEIRCLISEVRLIGKYIRSSEQAREKVSFFAKSLNMEVIPLCFDVRPLWSSVYDMISKFIKLKNPINVFLGYLKTPAGLAEFEWKDLPTLSPHKWGVLEGLSILLGCLYQAKSLLMYDKHPTAVYAISILRRVSGILKDSHTFYDEGYSGPLQRRITEFKEVYGKEGFFGGVCQKVDVVRSTLSDLFEEHFSGFDDQILWTSVLDPRLRKMKYLSEEEKLATRERLLLEVAKLRSEGSLKEEGEMPPASAATLDTHLFSPCDIFDAPWKEEEELSSEGAEREVNSYLSDDALVPFRKDPFEWWRQHRFQFPVIALLALKWLPASAISMDAFESLCVMKPWASKEQLMIMKNSESLNITIEDTMRGLDDDDT